MTCPKIAFDLIESEIFPEFNCKMLNLENVKYVLGPSTFYEFKLGNRTIKLFGEIHAPITRTFR